MKKQASATANARLARHCWRVEEIQERLIPWFANHGRTFPWRSDSASRYALIVSEVLLQRTRAGTVAEFFPHFIKRFPSWRRLAAATDEELRIVLEPIGLWRRRAASLRSLSREMQSRRGRFPATREELESLPGVGQYIASAVLMLCHGQKEPLLDVNMARVLERCFGPRKLVDIRYDPWLQALSRVVVNHPNPREINWAILDLAAAVCVNREPRCGECPLQECCRYAARRTGQRRASANEKQYPQVTVSARPRA